MFISDDPIQMLNMFNGKCVQACQEGDLTQAIKLAQLTIEFIEASRLTDHPSVASTFNNLATLYLRQENYAEAKPLFLHALLIREKVLGPEHPDVASTLNNLAALYVRQVKHAEAEPLYLRALSIYKKVLGSEHPYVSTSLSNLALLYEKQGKYAEAEPLYERALVINEKVLGPEHPDVATILNNLALLYESQGKYTEAEPLHLRALSISEKALGPEHPAVANSLNSLAVLYEREGKHAAAEPLLLRALWLREKVLGLKHPDVATTLNNLAVLYEREGKHAAAEPLYERALVINEKVLGSEHPYVANTLNNLAALYQSQGKYTKAESFYLRAQSILEKVLGPDHPSVVTSLNNLAELYRAQGRYTEAEPLYLDALVMRRNLLGEAHPDVAGSLNNLALLYQSQGRYEEAEPLYQQALALYRNLLGEANPDVATSLNNLAALYISRFMAKENDPELLNKALDCFCESTLVEVGLVAHSDDEASLNYIARNQLSFKSLFSLVLRYFTNNLAVHRKILDVVLQRKNLTQEAEFFLTEKLLSSEPDLQEIGKKYQSLKQRRTALVIRKNEASYPELSTTLQLQITKIEQELNDLRRLIGQRIPAVGFQQRLRQAERSAIALIMPPDSTLLEFVRFQVHDFATESWQDYKYAVFTMPQAQPDQVRLTFLEEPAASLDALIGGFRKQVEDKKGDRGFGDDDEPDNTIDFSSLLQERVLAPLLSHLQSKHLIIAGDGGFNYLPFDALKTADGTYLSEEFQISYLGCGRDILRWQAPELDQAQLSQPLILGDPEHELGNPQQNTTSNSATRDLEEFNEAIQPLLEQVGRRKGISPLPGAGIEAKRIAQQVGVTPYVREQALKARIEQAVSPVVAHFPLHASFEPYRRIKIHVKDAKSPTSDPLNAIPTPQTAQEQTQLGLDSFLVLAGAGSYRQGQSLPPEAGNGFLTAMECRHLSFFGTEMLGLSACLTAIGFFLTGEGVLGLRRAFILAGVRSVISTLWKIDDISTPILMDTFYKQILAGVPRLDALRYAQAHLRTITVKELRAEWLTEENIQEMVQRKPDLKDMLQTLLSKPDDHCPYQDSYYWSGFLLHGETGPLTTKALEQLRSKQY